MPQITLYIPNGAPQIFEVENYGLNEGRLHFRIDEGSGAFDVTTTVPYLIRQPVKEKEVSRNPSRSSRGTGSQWS